MSTTNSCDGGGGHHDPVPGPDLRTAALKLARRGISVFPCHDDGIAAGGGEDPRRY
jgi:hypothetical protein